MRTKISCIIYIIIGIIIAAHFRYVVQEPVPLFGWFITIIGWPIVGLLWLCFLLATISL